MHQKRIFLQNSCPWAKQLSPGIAALVMVETIAQLLNYSSKGYNCEKQEQMLKEEYNPWGSEPSFPAVVIFILECLKPWASCALPHLSNHTWNMFLPSTILACIRIMLWLLHEWPKLFHKSHWWFLLLFPSPFPAITPELCVKDPKHHKQKIIVIRRAEPEEGDEDISTPYLEHERWREFYFMCFSPNWEEITKKKIPKGTSSCIMWCYFCAYSDILGMPCVCLNSLQLSALKNTLS